MGSQLSFWEYEHKFLSEFTTPKYWKAKDPNTDIWCYGYLINRRGQLKKANTGKYLNGRRKPNKYVQKSYITIDLFIDGKKLKTSFHRLVACTFIKCLDREKQTHVNHIDHDKHNNHINNLEWVTPSENMISFAQNKIQDKDQLKLL